MRSVVHVVVVMLIDNGASECWASGWASPQRNSSTAKAPKTGKLANSSNSSHLVYRFLGGKGSSWLCSELSYYQHRPKHVLRTHWKLRHNERQIETNEFRSILASFLRAEEELSFPSYLDKKTNRSIDTRTLTHTYGAVKGVSKGRVTQLLQQLNFKHFCEWINC